MSALRLTLTVIVASGVSASVCSTSTNNDTNSIKDCKYLSPCMASDVPAAPSGYQIECETMPCPADQDIMFDKIEGTDIGELLPASCANTVAACQAACESTNGCCGFNFVFNPGQSNSQMVGRCVAKACDGRIGTSRFGMVYYQRAAGAVAGASSDPYSSSRDVVFWQATASGSISSITTMVISDIDAQIAQAVGVSYSDVSTSYLAGSVNIYATISIPSTTTLAAVKALADANLGTPSAANSYITAVNVASVQSVTETTDTAAASVVSSAGAAAWSAAWGNAFAEATGMAIGILIAIIVAPSVVGLCLLSLLIYCCCCRTQRKTVVQSSA